MTVFDYVSPYITCRRYTLDNFQGFVMVLMKVRLNVPFQDLAYRFQVFCQQFLGYFQHGGL